MRLTQFHYRSTLLTFVFLFLAGCTAGPADKAPAAKSADAAKGASSEETKIAAALAKLGPEDRELAAVQRWCASRTRTGSARWGRRTR